MLILIISPYASQCAEQDFSPPAREQQLPRAMHSAMQALPSITVGVDQGAIRGQDNRALQAAVDYIAGLGGGLVQIGPGDYLMHDSLHLRAQVTVRGTPGKTILRKANAAVSALVLDGDFGEQQITLLHPAGFAVGQGVAVWDSGAGGFHTTVARITGQNGSTFAITNPLMADCMVNNQAQAATVFPVVSGYHIEGAHVEDLIIEGSRATNPYLNGCRGAGIYVRGHTNDLVFKENIIRETRPTADQTQTIGIHMDEHVGKVVLEDNIIEAQQRIEDKRTDKAEE